MLLFFAALFTLAMLLDGMKMKPYVLCAQGRGGGRGKLILLLPLILSESRFSIRCVVGRATTEAATASLLLCARRPVCGDGPPAAADFHAVPPTNLLRSGY